MNESFGDFYKKNLKKSFCSIDMWMTEVIDFFIIMFIVKSGKSSNVVLSYIIAAIVFIVSSVLINIISEFLKWKRQNK